LKLKEKAKELKEKLPIIYIAMKSKQTPWFAKIVAFSVIIYALSPIDLIPDFIPILGYLDDLIILPFLIILAFKLIPKDLMEEFKEQAKTIWDQGKPVHWYYAIPFLFIWCIVLFFVVKAIWF